MAGAPAPRRLPQGRAARQAGGRSHSRAAGPVPPIQEHRTIRRVPFLGTGSLGSFPMTSEETYAKALRMMELAKSTMNPSRRRTIMDDAFALIREAKRLRQKEPAKANGVGAPRYRVWFHGPLGYLYFDLPMTRRSDALWAAEALAAALSDDYDRYALWNGQTQPSTAASTTARNCASERFFTLVWAMNRATSRR